MPKKKVESIDDVHPNAFEAIKRAFIRRGRVPRPKTAAEAAKEVRRPGRAQQTSKKQPKKASEPPAGEKETQEIESASNAEVTQTGSNSSSSEPTKAEKADKEAETGPEELIELTERVHDILYEATTVFPFTLFPDTITLDREKLTIANRFFWRTADITSVPISEILSCTVNVGPFFGSIHLVFSFFADNERRINFLWRHEAMELQRMVHGFIIAHKREINTTNVSTDDLRTMLKEIGHGAAE